MQESPLSDKADEITGPQLLLLNRILSFVSQSEHLEATQKVQQVLELVKEACK